MAGLYRLFSLLSNIFDNMYFPAIKILIVFGSPYASCHEECCWERFLAGMLLKLLVGAVHRWAEIIQCAEPFAESAADGRIETNFVEKFELCVFAIANRSRQCAYWNRRRAWACTSSEGVNVAAPFWTCSSRRLTSTSQAASAPDSESSCSDALCSSAGKARSSGGCMRACRDRS